MITSITPTHSHIIPITAFSAKKQAGDKIIHIIPKIKVPLLLMIISPKKFKVSFSLFYHKDVNLQ